VLEAPESVREFGIDHENLHAIDLSLTELTRRLGCPCRPWPEKLENRDHQHAAQRFLSQCPEVLPIYHVRPTEARKKLHVDAKCSMNLPARYKSWLSKIAGWENDCDGPKVGESPRVHSPILWGEGVTLRRFNQPGRENV